MRYIFFFSYARTNRDEYLMRFYKDLRRRVEVLVGLSPEELKSTQIAFLDEREIELGSEWEPDLIDALQNSSVLVCAYSPNYFVSEYCSREWHVFQMRRREWPDYKAGLAPMPASIKPVIWVSPARRMTKDAVHAEVFGLQYKLGQTDAIYNTDGVEPMLRRMNTYADQYEAFMDDLADAIIDASDLTPELPVLGPPAPRLSEIPPLFPLKKNSRTPVEPPQGDAALPALRSALVFANVLLDNANPETVASSLWRPFGAGTPCIDFIVQDIAERDLNSLCRSEYVSTIDELAQLIQQTAAQFQLLVMLTDLPGATLLAQSKPDLEGFPLFVLGAAEVPATDQKAAPTSAALRSALIEHVPRMMSQRRAAMHIALPTSIGKPAISVASHRTG